MASFQRHTKVVVAGLSLLWCSPSTVRASLPSQLWDFDPDYYPSPTNATLRPPIAKWASTDPRLLPYQILGLVGGYVLFTLVLFICLLTFGRRWRRSAQTSHGTLSMEMVKPNRWMATHGRGSPTNKSASSLKRWGTKGPSATASPVAPGVASFDGQIVEDHKARQDAEMAQIYDQLMGQDTKSPRSISVKEDEITGTSPYMGHTRTLSNSSRSFSQRRPPQMQGTDVTPVSPTKPLSPTGSHHSAYPPRPLPQQYPLSPRSPLSVNDYQSAHSRQHSDSSLHSKSTVTSATTTQQTHQNQDRTRKAKSTRSVRNLTISAPMSNKKYFGGSDDDEEARTPLSPRNYSNVMPPPSPPGDRPITPIQDEFEDDEADTERDVYGYNGLHGRRAMPQAAPQRGNVYSNPYSPPPLPPPPQFSSVESTGPPTNASANGLPLRNYATTSAASSSTVVGLPVSPGPTKTTLLSPRRDQLPKKPAGGSASALGFVGMAPLTGGLPTGGLGTAVPGTPLSPYMPFTPVTPVTPRLTTRDDRRRRVREEGRRVATEEDGVRDEKEVWGAAW